MILQEDLKKENILLNPKSQNRWQLIDELLNLAEKNKELDPGIKDIVRERLIEREKTASTGIGNEVAIPHCAINEIKNTLVLMAISKKGIEFDSIDGAPAKIIILLIVSMKKMTSHIKNLTSIAKILKDETFRNSLLKLKSADAVMQAFKTYHSK
jgi:mannitol/fructose-specific phosphotransferase system IIA component (Ntr-type)